MSTPPAIPQLSPAELRENKQSQLLPIFIIFSILPIFAATLRVLARRIKQMKLWWDDYLILMASALVVAQLAFLAEALQHGLGKHMQAITQKDVKLYLLYTYLSELYYATAITLVKCSVVCLYLRIFSIDRKFKVLCYCMIAFVGIWGVVVNLVTIFQCKPVQAGWDKSIPGEQCLVLEHFLIGTNVPNIIADVAIIALPVPLIWKLQLSRMRKLGLVTVFFLAAVGTIISIIRVTFNAHIDVTDPTWGFIKVAILSTIEVSVGVCCACMPVIYPLLRVIAGRKVAPSTESSAALKAGYRREPLRPQHKFSQLEEGSVKNYTSNDKLGNNRSNDNGQERGGYDDVTLGQIIVTSNINVEHSRVA